MSGKGSALNGGNSFANGNSMNNGSTPLRLVKSQQDAGFAIRPASIWDYLEPGGIA